MVLLNRNPIGLPSRSGAAPTTPERNPVATNAAAVAELAEQLSPEQQAREDNHAGERERQKSWADACDTEYWVCLCFASREEKEVFLDSTGLANIGDKYLDGADVAKLWEIPLPPRPRKPLVARKRAGSRLLKFVR